MGLYDRRNSRPYNVDEDDPWLGDPFGRASYDTQRISENRSSSTGGNRNRRDTSSRQERGSGQLGKVDPRDYGTPWITGSNEWYGKRNQLGAQAAANSPGAFWSLYGEDVQGWDPAGNASAFMANTFNPMAMGAAMFGSKDFTSLEEVLGGSTGIANKLGGGNAMFVDPAALVGNTLQALASGSVEDLKGVNPMLASIITSNIGNPGGQVSSLVQFLQEALMGSMPEDMLSAFLSTIERLGNSWFSQISDGPMKNMDVTSFAKYLMQTLGPTLGL